MLDKHTGEITYVRKIRGITFDKNNEDVLAYDHFKQMVLSKDADDYGNDETTTFAEEEAVYFNYNRIGPTSKSDVLTRKMCKIYRVVNNKGWTDPKTHIVYPFGYKK